MQKNFVHFVLLLFVTGLFFSPDSYAGAKPPRVHNVTSKEDHSGMVDVEAGRAARKAAIEKVGVFGLRRGDRINVTFADGVTRAFQVINPLSTVGVAPYRMVDGFTEYDCSGHAMLVNLYNVKNISYIRSYHDGRYCTNKR